MTTALVIALIVAALVIAYLTARVNGLRRRCTEYGQKFYDNVIAANQMQETIDTLDRRNEELGRKLTARENDLRFLRFTQRLEAETQFAFPTLAPDRGDDEPAAAVIYDELVLGVAS